MIHDDDQLNKNDALAQAISGIPDLEPPADLAERIMAQVDAEEKVLAPSLESSHGSVLSGRFSSLKYFVPAAAAVALIVLALPLFSMDLKSIFDSEGPPVETSGSMANGGTPSNTINNNSNANTGSETVVAQGVEPVLVSSVDYVAEKDLDAFFETWDEELVSAQEEGLNVSDDSFGDDYEALLYEDPLSALVGF